MGEGAIGLRDEVDGEVEEGVGDGFLKRGGRFDKGEEIFFFESLVRGRGA